jgi:hydroxyacylglutathione hydrolase
VEIQPGIHKIDGTFAVNCYLLKGEMGWLIVDTGLPGQEHKILNYLKKQNILPSKVALIVLTHADIDHIGCAKALKTATGAPIAIHSADAPVLAGRQPFKTINNFFGPAVKLLFSCFPFQPVEPDILLEEMTLPGDWQIIHTPGHTPGNICLFQNGKCLLAGDALRTSWQANPRPMSSRICLDMAQTRQSLIKISKLNYEVLLPGHGAVIKESASQIIQKMVNRVTAKPLNTRKILGIY